MTNKDTYVVEMPDGSEWGVPVRLIIKNRAQYYHKQCPKEFPTFESAIQNSTEELSDIREIRDWASNNMDWDDVKHEAELLKSPPCNDVDYQEGWTNGYHYITDIYERKE